jgi:DNA-binding transcriptional MerR regulator
MFLAGEFSKLAQVSKRQLRYYQEIALFQPQHIDLFTGYRYYTAAQLPRLNKILALKELGLSLDQIAEVLNDHISADEIQGMLRIKKAEMEQELHEELRRFRYIESRIRQIDIDGILQDYDVVLKSTPEQRILVTRTQLSEIAQMRQLMIQILRLLPEQIGSRYLKHMIVISHSVAYDTEDLDIEIGYVVDAAYDQTVTLAEGTTLKVRSLEAVEAMATITRVGASRLGSACYQALAHWIESNQVRIVGLGREVFLHLEANRDDEMVTEIQMPVEKIIPNNLSLT